MMLCQTHQHERSAIDLHKLGEMAFCGIQEL
jgi:hypothetical protein